MDIVEHKIDIERIGSLKGMPVQVIEMSNCNLDCSFCLKEDKNEVNYQWNPHSVVNKIENEGIKDVVFSGGEPLLQNEELQRVIGLMDLEYGVTIKTNGIVRDSAIRPNEYIVTLMVQVLPYNDIIETIKWYKESGLETSYHFMVKHIEDIDLISKITNRYIGEEVYLTPKGVTEKEILEKVNCFENPIFIQGDE